MSIALIAEAAAYGVDLRWAPDRVIAVRTTPRPIPPAMLTEIDAATGDIWALLDEYHSHPREEA